MRISALLISILAGISGLMAQEVLSLQDCRNLAISNNKQLMMMRQRITTAKYQNKEAFAAYLPSIDFEGGYVYNQKEISVFDSDQLLPIKTFNVETQSYEFNLAKNPLTGELLKNSKTGEYIPESVALMPKEALTYDIHNVFFGAITLTQPIYMGARLWQ